MHGPWVLLVLIVHLVSCNLSNTKKNEIDPTPEVYEPSWTYKCVPDEGCQRSPHPDSRMLNSSSPMHYESMSVCRTVCGRFGGLWPRPLTAALTTQTIKIHPNYIRFDLVGVPAPTRDLISRMAQIASRNLQKECRLNVTEVVETPVVVYISIKSPSLALSWDTQEQYMLDVQTKEGSVAVHIAAETVYGARHGLETFTQLVAPDIPDYTQEHTCSLNIVTGAKIKDRPAFRHRGFMLDTSRNFIPLPSIKKMIDGMAATKLNVFHWHVTDSHSFPLESSRVPQFTRYGAYSAMEIYSVEDVRELIKYAQERGVRVVIEIDQPAHAGNGWQWGKEYGLGDLAVCVNAKPWRNLCIQPPCGQLNPANQNTYTVLKNLYRDIVELVPKPALLHVGGDEVYLNCWNQTEEITSYMTSKNIPITYDGFIQLWAEFHEKSLQAWDQELAAAGEKEKQPVMIWSSQLTQPERIKLHLDPNRYIIEVWEPFQSSMLYDLLHSGYRTVTVPKDVWYLDHGFWGTTKFANWRRMYAYSLPENENMLGGEVAMWSEYVDAQNLDTRVWPRAAAVAERLWTNPTSAANVAEPRLHRMRERLINRGIRTDVLSPAWCAQHDNRCL